MRILQDAMCCAHFSPGTDVRLSRSRVEGLLGRHFPIEVALRLRQSMANLRSAEAASNAPSLAVLDTCLGHSHISNASFNSDPRMDSVFQMYAGCVSLWQALVAHSALMLTTYLQRAQWLSTNASVVQRRRTAATLAWQLELLDAAGGLVITGPFAGRLGTGIHMDLIWLKPARDCQETCSQRVADVQVRGHYMGNYTNTVASTSYSNAGSHWAVLPSTCALATRFLHRHAQPIFELSNKTDGMSTLDLCPRIAAVAEPAGITTI